MFRAQQDALDARRPFAIGFTIPKEGAVLAVDNFVLHKSGRRPDLAHCFIDFMLDGVNAADISNPVSYTHLDVYKRQGQRRAAGGIAGQFGAGSGEVLRDRRYARRRLAPRFGSVSA